MSKATGANTENIYDIVSIFTTLVSQNMAVPVAAMNALVEKIKVRLKHRVLLINVVETWNMVTKSVSSVEAQALVHVTVLARLYIDFDSLVTLVHETGMIY